MIGVAVVGGHHAHAAALVHRRDHLAEAPIDGLDRLHSRLDHARVTDHVGVREIDDPERRRILAPSVRKRCRRLARAHLRLVVVGRHVPRRVDQLAALARQRRLLAAVEEVRHMRVLLGLGHVQLLGPRCRQHDPERRRGRSGGKTTG